MKLGFCSSCYPFVSKTAHTRYAGKENGRAQAQEYIRSHCPPVHCEMCRRCVGCGCLCKPCRTCPASAAFGLQRHPPPQFCKVCKQCKISKCACRKRPKYYYFNMDRDAVKYRINPIRRMIGLELELGEWGTVAQTRFNHLSYTPDHDGSVRPSMQEMVLNPLLGDAFFPAMTELATKCHMAGAIVNDTCGFHVHIEAADIGYWDLRRLLEVYARLEGEIFQYLLAPHRSSKLESEHYTRFLTRRHNTAKCPKCLERPQYAGQTPLLQDLLPRLWLAKRTTDIKAVMLEMLYGIKNPINHGEEVEARKRDKYISCRYYALNLHTMNYRGTIEFRHKEAVLDVRELTIWPMFCAWMVELSTRLTDTQAREPLGLAAFTRRHMPGWIAAWVEDRIAQKAAAA
jgi:hypothetical protein